MAVRKFNSSLNKVLCGNCEEVLKSFPDNCIDLILTSPPYANKRGGPKAEQYVDWFLPIAQELFRVLRPDGSFILNIKEGAEKGERQPYVMELVLALRAQGWCLPDEMIWFKQNCLPGGWPNRFRDAWEHLYHFTKQKNFSIYKHAVMVPAAESTRRRACRLSPTDRRPYRSGTGSGFITTVESCVRRSRVFPSNVLVMANETSNQHHSAAFPAALPTFFIKLLTKPGDLVLDPFLGSGTTAIAAKHLGRRYVGIEIDPKYAAVAKDRLERG